MTFGRKGGEPRSPEEVLVFGAMALGFGGLGLWGVFSGRVGGFIFGLFLLAIGGAFLYEAMSTGPED